MKAIFSAITGAISGKVVAIVVAALVVLVAGYVVIEKNRDKTLVNTGKEAGAAAAVNAGQRDILNQVERANNAEQEINRSNDADRLARCLRNATPATRANCGRFGPVPD